MVQITIKTEGLSQMVDSFRKIRDNISTANIKMPIKLGNLARDKIREKILRESYKGNSRYGPYRRRTGQGMGDAIRVWSQVKGQAVIDVDPALSGPSEPATYANYVENGTSHAQAKHYFRDGFRSAVTEMNKEIKRTADNILKTK